MQISKDKCLQCTGSASSHIHIFLDKLWQECTKSDFVRLTNRVRAPYKTPELMSFMSRVESGATHQSRTDTMRHPIVALLTVCALSSTVVFADEVQYTTKFDNVDVDGIISNERLLNGYVGCLLDRNPCTPDAAELKSKCVHI